MKIYAFIILLSFSGYAFSDEAPVNTEIYCGQTTQILSSDMSIHLNSIQLGSTMYWATLEFVGELEQGQFSWKLGDYGILENCVDDGSDAIVRINPDQSIEINIAHFIDSFHRSSAPMPLSITLSFNGIGENEELLWNLLNYAIIEDIIPESLIEEAEQLIDEAEQLIEEVTEAIAELETIEVTGPSGSSLTITLNEDPNSAGPGGFSLDFGGNTGVVMNLIQGFVSSGFTF